MVRTHRLHNVKSIAVVERPNKFVIRGNRANTAKYEMGTWRVPVLLFEICEARGHPIKNVQITAEAILPATRTFAEGCRQTDCFDHVRAIAHLPTNRASGIGLVYNRLRS